jgi:tripartite-type tricarboxylate transporter receptor subunit TctC
MSRAQTPHPVARAELVASHRALFQILDRSSIDRLRVPLRGSISLAAALLTLAVSRPASAEDFFAGKTITLSTHSEVGGGYDAYLRLLARHMGRYVPGHPAFTVLNQPGEGGRLAVNNAAKAAQDGTFLTLVAQSVLTMGVTSRADFETPLAGFKWVGNFDQSNNVTVAWAGSNVRTLADAMARDVVVGATGAGTASELGPTLYNALIGTRFKVKVGYSGGDAIDAAMERGEVDGRANSIWASIKMTLGKEIGEHKVNVLIQMGVRKEPELPDVPLLTDLMAGDARKAAVAQFMSRAVSTARPLAAPPGVPEERVAILRGAFDATVRDPDFLADARKLNLEVDPMNGAETQAIVAGVLTAPPSVLADARSALSGVPLHGGAR